MRKPNTAELRYEWGIKEGDHLRFPPVIADGGVYDELVGLSGSFKTAAEADRVMESHATSGKPLPEMVLLRFVWAAPQASAN